MSDPVSARDPWTFARAVSDAFALGDPVQPPAEVVGGLSHRMWRLTTSRGSFAVKELNRDFGNPNYLPWYDRAFRVELAAFRAGISMPRPLPVPGAERCYAELPGGEHPVTVRVHEWVEGRMPAPDDDFPALGRAIGEILGRIHGLALPGDRALADLLTVHGAAHWQTLSERVQRADRPWAARLAQVLPAIAELEAVVIAARHDPEPAVMTHCDADVKNALITRDGRMLLVDWDAAGPASPRHEIVTAMLDWSGTYERDPDPATAHAVLAGYRAAGGAPPAADATAFAGVFKSGLNWLEYNLRRSLGERLQSEAQRQIAEDEVVMALEYLPRFAVSWQRWLRLLE